MATNYSPKIVTDGLVLCLDAANPKSYSGLGTSWKDLSLSNANATLSGGFAYSMNDNGTLMFDGNSGRATLNASTFDFSSEQTIFVILKPDESDGSRRNPYNHAYGGYGTITHEPSGSFNYYHGTDGGNSSPYQGTGSLFTVDQNEISAITLARDPSDVKWYKNGKFITSESNSYPTAVSSTNTILIGDGYTTNYLGAIYCVLLYDRALTQA